MLNFKMLVFCRVCEISSKTFQLLFSLWLLRNFKLLFLYPVTSILGRNLEGNGILKSMHIFIMKNNLSYQQNLRIIPCVYSVMSKSLRSMNCRHQAFLSMEFSRQEYWSGLPFPSPGDLPDSGIEPASLASPAMACRFFTAWERRKCIVKVLY